MSIQLPRLAADPHAPFPPLTDALRDPEGLLAYGGDLSPERLIHAYREGIFPWYSDGQPILWWSPDPRAVFHTDAMHLPRRLRRWLRQCEWRIEIDRRFDAVVATCAAPRHAHDGTWITPAMRAAYSRLHRLGHAHSIEICVGERLIGGLYGVAVGRMFCAESMFSRETNASKVALLALARLLRDWEYPLIDAQVMSPHIETLGAKPMPRSEFIGHLQLLRDLQPPAPLDWRDAAAPTAAQLI